MAGIETVAQNPLIREGVLIACTRPIVQGSLMTMDTTGVTPETTATTREAIAWRGTSHKTGHHRLMLEAPAGSGMVTTVVDTMRVVTEVVVLTTVTPPETTNTTLAETDLTGVCLTIMILVLIAMMVVPGLNTIGITQAPGTGEDILDPGMTGVICHLLTRLLEIAQGNITSNYLKKMWYKLLAN